MKTAFLIILISGSYTLAQDKLKKNLNLEDIEIKGELLNDSRMSLMNRKKEELKNRVKFRTNYREEILQEYSASSY